MKSLTQYLDRFFSGDANDTLVQLFRYGVVSVGVFVVDFSLLFIITHYFGVYYLISAGIAFVVGLFLKHFFCIQWVFKERTIRSKRLEFAVFAAIGLGSLILNEGMLWVLTDIVGIYYLYSKVITSGALVLVKFSVRKKFLFS